MLLAALLLVRAPQFPLGELPHCTVTHQMWVDLTLPSAPERGLYLTPAHCDLQRWQVTKWETKKWIAWIFWNHWKRGWHSLSCWTWTQVALWGWSWYSYLAATRGGLRWDWGHPEDEEPRDMQREHRVVLEPLDQAACNAGLVPVLSRLWKPIHLFLLKAVWVAFSVMCN